MAVRCDRSILAQTKTIDFLSETDHPFRICLDIIQQLGWDDDHELVGGQDIEVFAAELGYINTVLVISLQFSIVTRVIPYHDPPSS